jgi:hypothetical protein
MFKIERKAELTDTGAIVHKRLVTPWFYIRLKPVSFELESGYYRVKIIPTFIGFGVVPILFSFKCDRGEATHAGEKWIGKDDSLTDYNFLCDSYPRKITKLKAINDPS